MLRPRFSIGREQVATRALGRGVADGFGRRASGMGRADQRATAGKLMSGSSLIWLIVSSVMYLARGTAHSSFCSSSSAPTRRTTAPSFRAFLVDFTHQSVAGFRRHMGQRMHSQLAGDIRRRRNRQLIEHAETDHDLGPVADIGRTFGGHVQKFGVFSPQTFGHFRQASIRAEFILLPGQTFTRRFGHKRKSTHRQRCPMHIGLFRSGKIGMSRAKESATSV